MRRFALIAAFAAFACITSYWFGAQTRSRPPLAESDVPAFQPSEIDLGEQPWNQKVEFAFDFVNSSSVPVTVESVKSSCGCTASTENLAGVNIAAGATRRLGFILDTLKNPGTKKREIKLRTTSGAEFVASVKVDVRGSYSVDPDNLVFGEIALDDPTIGDEPIEKVIAFRSATDALIDVTAPRAKWLECRASKTGAAHADVTIRLVPEHLRAGVNTASVTIRSSSKVKPESAIFVRAIGVRDLIPARENVTMSVHQPVEIPVARRDGKPADLCAIETDRAELLADLVDTAGIRLVLSRIDPAASWPARVRIRDLRGYVCDVRVTPNP